MADERVDRAVDEAIDDEMIEAARQDENTSLTKSPRGGRCRPRARA
jgi:hypothetical protein